MLLLCFFYASSTLFLRFFHAYLTLPPRSLARTLGDIVSVGLFFQLLICVVCLAVYMVSFQSIRVINVRKCYFCVNCWSNINYCIDVYPLLVIRTCYTQFARDLRYFLWFSLVSIAIEATTSVDFAYSSGTREISHDWSWHSRLFAKHILIGLSFLFS